MISCQQFTFPGTSLTVNRMGYGAMQLAGPGVWGPPKDRDGAIAVLREAVAAGVNHIDTSDFYGPHVTNQIIREALSPSWVRATASKRVLSPSKSRCSQTSSARV
jgi:aryl-alcohol dehydrogenase-like predicted oxidoreductase